MANPSKRKGSDFEKAVAEYLAAHGHPLAERRVQGGTKDRGDIAGVIGWTLECKNERSIDLAGAVDEAEVEAANADTRWFAAIIKRRNKSVSEAYVVVPLRKFAESTSWRTAHAIDEAAA